MFSGQLTTPDRFSYHTDYLWAPPPTFVDRRAAVTAADNLTARRRCHCCCVLISLLFSMTKKGHQKILRIERNFLGYVANFSAAAAAIWDRQADQNCPARPRRHNDVGARL